MLNLKNQSVSETNILKGTFPAIWGFEKVARKHACLRHFCSSNCTPHYGLYETKYLTSSAVVPVHPCVSNAIASFCSGASIAAHCAEPDRFLSPCTEGGCGHGN